MTIAGGDGNDYISNDGDSVTIAGGDGNDGISNDYGSKVTINGGAGKDYIYLDTSSTEVLIEYVEDDGDDTIYGYNLTDTIKLTSGSIINSLISGDDLILNFSGGSIHLVNTSTANIEGTFIDSTTTEGTSGNDLLSNDDSNVTLNGYGGNDTIYNSGENVLINAGDGNNKIRDLGEDSTIRTGNGNNTIYSSADFSSILSGSGKDSIRNTSYSTIDAGAGNDILHGGAGNDTLWGGVGNDSLYGDAGSDVFIYRPGEGTDTIFDYQSGDMLQILKADGSPGSYTNATFSNNKLTLAIDGGGTVVFDNVSSSDTININGTELEKK